MGVLRGTSSRTRASASPASASIATTVPGFGGTAAACRRLERGELLELPHPASQPISRATSSSGTASRSTLALEMVSAGGCSGPVVLLSPSFSRKDGVDLPTCARSPEPRLRTSAVCAHDEVDRAGLREQLASGWTQVPGERVEKKRSALRPCPNPLLSCVSRPPRLAREAFLRRQHPDMGCFRWRRTTSASHPPSANCSRRLRT